ncbi:MAG: AMP-binding protein [Clostridia bacterium]|nr:AMP-binding protein [Clostridia bacterium]
MKMLNPLSSIPPINYTDLRHLVVNTAETFGDKPLYDYNEGGEKKTVTYPGFAAMVESFATALDAAGLAGHRVVMIGETHPAYLATYIATICTNGTIIPMDKELAPEQVAAFIKHAEADVVVYTAAFNSRFTAEEYDFLTLRVPVQPEADYVRREGLVSFADMLADGAAAKAAGNTSYAERDLDMEKCAILLFTSGTTGTSKGVMLSHYNIISALNSATHTMPYDQSCTFVSVLPIHHTYEMLCGQLGVLAIGGSMLINDSIKRVLKNFAEYKPNTLILVPLFVETLHKRIWDEIRRRGMEKKVRFGMSLAERLLGIGIDIRKKLFSEITAAFGGNLTSIVCGGAPINPKILKDLYLFGVTVFEGYGITECSPLVAVNSSRVLRPRSVGAPVFGCEVKIDYDDAPTDGGPRTGEILVKGPNVMMGYYKNEEATAAVFTEDGFFRTGDIGYLDKDNFIFITGRKKNVIILSNGKNVFPEELEEYIAEIPFVKESVVLGRKHEGAEVAITAIVVPDLENPALGGMTPSAVYDAVKAAITEINKRVPTFKHITDIEIRTEEFEKNTSKKIKRYLVT